jgi:hypothetical protein
LFDFERGINGLAAEQRLCVRKEQGAASDGSRLLRSASVAEPIDSMLKRWDRFARFIGGRRIRLSNDAAERALRGFALGRKSWVFACSDRGAGRAALLIGNYDPLLAPAGGAACRLLARPSGSCRFLKKVDAPANRMPAVVTTRISKPRK